MPNGVGQRLHRDPVSSDLGGGRQWRELRRRDDTDRCPVSAELFGLTTQRTHQAELVQRRWAQLVDQPPDVVDRFGSSPAQLAGQRVRPYRVGPNEIARGIGLEGTPVSTGPRPSWRSRRNLRRSSSRAATMLSRER
jgi:hypothetical protein